MLGAIEWDKIGELVWVAPVAALAISLTFSLMILGSGRAAEARRGGAGGAAMLYSLLALLATVAFTAVVVYGVVVIVNK
jgi:hypothetical protein